MVRPQKLRTSTPQTVRKLWEAVIYIRQAKQIPNRERIKKYMQRENDNMKPKEIHNEIDYAVKDNLLVSYQSIACKGSKVGEEQEGFKVPEGDFEERGDNDWYCFTCHKGGEVLSCAECWRVYHSVCTEEDWTGQIFLCSVCKATRKRKKIKNKKLNTLLGYTIQRLKEKAKELHQLAKLDEDESLQRLIYMPIDLNTMEEKVVDRDYRTLDEFAADANTLLHNVVVVHGEYSEVADLAKVVIEDCQYDVDEIKKCADCYFMSNAKPKDWFCQPCDPPHELVYAKLKGYSYWPSKVIGYPDDDSVDVRFFGTQHQRAVLPNSSTKPIDVDYRTLNVKRTQGFMKSLEELKKHQDIVKKRRKADSDCSQSGSESEAEPMETEDLPPVITSSLRGNIQDENHEEADLVTSTEDSLKAPKLTPSMSSVSTQTKKIPEPKKPVKTPTKSQCLQTEFDDSAAATTPAVVVAQPSQLKLEDNPEYQIKIEQVEQSLEKKYKQEKQQELEDLENRLRKDFEEDKQAAVSRVMGNVQKEVEKAKSLVEDKHSDEHKKLIQKHKAEISATKKKQWCYNCEEEAMYHCCWNTSYCSIKCQQQHWHKEHKKVCRRKR